MSVFVTSFRSYCDCSCLLVYLFVMLFINMVAEVSSHKVD